MTDLASQLVDGTLRTFPDWEPGTRAAHAHGTGVRGWFRPSGALAPYSSAAHLAGPDPVEVLARFSNGPGNSPRRDRDRDARGLAVKFQPDTDLESDLIAMTLSTWFTKTPEATIEAFDAAVPVPVHRETWRERLDRVLHLRKPYAPPEPGATTEVSPRKLADFARLHPEARKSVATAGHLITPRSYGRAAYHGVHSFVLVNGTRRTHFRYTWYPTAGVRAMPAEVTDGVDDDGNWLHDEMDRRLRRGPIEFTLNVYLADVGDDVTDPTKQWSKKRRRLVAGRLVLHTPVADHETDCERRHFNPGRLVPGIEASSDPILLARIAAYEESGLRREATGCPIHRPVIDLREPAPHRVVH